jgi:hypothetical protein
MLKTINWRFVLRSVLVCYLWLAGAVAFVYAWLGCAWVLVRV